MTFFALWNTKEDILESVGYPTFLLVPVYAQENFGNRTKYIFIRVSKWWIYLFYHELWVYKEWIVPTDIVAHLCGLSAFSIQSKSTNFTRQHPNSVMAWKWPKYIHWTVQFTCLHGQCYSSYARQKHWLLWVGCNL